MVTGCAARRRRTAAILQEAWVAEEIDSVRQLLTSLPRPTGFAERRARIDTVASIDGVAPDIAFERVELGSCEGESSLAPGSDPAKVLLFFHGGGYCSGSIRSHRGMVSETGRAAKVRTLAVGYRLAPENPFPAALDDAVAAFEFLLAQGVAASHIAIAGDSAGGGISLSTMARLRDAGKPLPGAAWLVSPWVDLEMTGATIDSKAAIDPLIHREYLQELAAAYLSGASPRDPQASPLYAELGRLPPVLIQVGSAETLLDDSIRIAGRLGAADVAVRLEVWPHMIHAWHLWSARLTAGRAAIASAAAFIQANLV
jgi:acetyl esterase/lipase